MFDRFRNFKIGAKQKRILYLIGGCLIIGITFIFALTLSKQQKIEENPDIPRMVDLDLFKLSINVIVSLVVVVGVIYLIYYVYKWWQSKGIVKTTRKMQLIETMRLSQTQALHIIKIEGSRYIIGATDHSIQLLKELPEQEDSEDEQPFSDILTESINNKS